MVKVQGPALSLAASGKLAGAMVFSSWKGRPYVRELVKPANPRSGGQVGIRAMMKFLSQQWKSIVSVDQATWLTRAGQTVISAFNAYVGYNVARWRDFVGPSQVDPATALATNAVIGAATATPGVRSMTLTIPITTANDGWGVAVFRSPTAAFDTTFDKLIACGAVDGVNDIVLIDSPLAPGTYYYDVRPFTTEGLLGAEKGEFDGTIV